MNGDAVDDFTIEYSKGIWDGAGASGFLYSAGFKPVGENKILSEYEENVSTTFLFAKVGDSIKRVAPALQEWYHLGRFSTLFQGGDGVWSKAWQIESKKDAPPYYAGVQIMANDSSLIGWLKLEIDKSTGTVEILKHKLTPDDLIIIDE